MTRTTATNIPRRPPSTPRCANAAFGTAAYILALCFGSTLLAADPRSDLQHANDLLRNGDAAAALTIYDRAVELAASAGPMPSELSFNRGLALLALKRHDEARAEFGSTLAARPQPALEAQARMALAHTHFDQALALWNSARASQQQPDTQAITGLLRDAIAAYRHAAPLLDKPDDAYANVEQIGRLLQRLATDEQPQPPPPPQPQPNSQNDPQQDDESGEARSQPNADPSDQPAGQNRPPGQSPPPQQPAPAPDRPLSPDAANSRPNPSDPTGQGQPDQPTPPSSPTDPTDRPPAGQMPDAPPATTLDSPPSQPATSRQPGQTPGPMPTPAPSAAPADEPGTAPAGQQDATGDQAARDSAAPDPSSQQPAQGSPNGQDPANPRPPRPDPDARPVEPDRPPEADTSGPMQPRDPAALRNPADQLTEPDARPEGRITANRGTQFEAMAPRIHETSLTPEEFLRRMQQIRDNDLNRRRVLREAMEREIQRDWFFSRGRDW